MPIKKFFQSPIAGGAVLILCTVIALVLANVNATSAWFTSIWHTNLTVGFEDFGLSKPLEMWINDALMAVFFFAIGLEIKREIVAGELRSLRQASLPIAAAIGGMVVPALIYAIFNAGQTTAAGWGIPMATDIAFALGILSIMNKRVPLSLKIFLAALAIVDDLGAILVIAIFYSSAIDWYALLAAAGLLVGLYTLAKCRVYTMKWYFIPSIVLWLLFLKSGVHATIAGVLIAFTLPTTAKYTKERFWSSGQKLIDKFKAVDVASDEVLHNDNQLEAVQSMRDLARHTISPAQRIEHALHSTVAFFIMPIFALCNAGVILSSDAASHLLSDQSMGIILGLFIGKPLGIMLFSFFVLKSGLAVMPSGATWVKLFGVACLGGIGFTMSIFIDNLAFSDVGLIAIGKLAILTASVLAAVLGSFILSRTPKEL